MVSDFDQDVELPKEEEEENKVLPIRKEDVRIAQYPMALSEIMNRLYKGRVMLQPIYQRRYVWSDESAESFIDSLWNGIPVPPIFLLSKKDNPLEVSTLEVIDGQQRLTSLFRFMRSGSDYMEKNLCKDMQKRNDELNVLQVSWDILQSGEYSSNDRVSYGELSQGIQDRFGDIGLPVIIIEPIKDEVGDTIAIEMFRRLNTGGVKLTSQEIRLCVYMSEMLQEIKEFAEGDKWKSLLPTYHAKYKDDLSLASEQALRIIAFWEWFRPEKKEDVPVYEQPIKEYLDKYAKVIQGREKNGESQISLIRLIEKAVRSMIDIYQDKDAGDIFRNIRDTTDGRKREMFNFSFLEMVLIGCIQWHYTHPLEERLPVGARERIDNQRMSLYEKAQSTSSKKEGFQERIDAGIELFKGL